jgi:glyoxylase-like metal-dependent hydrolase (beta-lactamase superfamily II)
VTRSAKLANVLSKAQQIIYTDTPTPEPGELTQITPGVFWLRMPLPFELDHINLYLIEDDHGYAILDTGIGTSLTETLWETIFTLLDSPITKVICTHMHPDHIGMAGYLVEKFKVPFYISGTEYFVGRALSAGGRGASDWQDDDYLVKCGMSQEYVAKAKENRKNNKGVGQVIRPIPLQFERLQAGGSLILNQQKWDIIIGRGHSPEHVCLFNKQTNVLISGDHVLPIISPNIGVYSTEPNANSLQLYLDTLPQFKDLPADALVLPSHKTPFTGLHARVDELIEHHHKHLNSLREFCADGKTIKDCLPVLFKRKLNPHNMFFAVAEAFAHLNYLYFADEFTREVNEEGQYIFQTKN